MYKSNVTGIWDIKSNKYFRLESKKTARAWLESLKTSFNVLYNHKKLFKCLLCMLKVHT